MNGKQGHAVVLLAAVYILSSEAENAVRVLYIAEKRDIVKWRIRVDKLKGEKLEYQVVFVLALLAIVFPIGRLYRYEIVNLVEKKRVKIKCFMSILQIL